MKKKWRKFWQAVGVFLAPYLYKIFFATLRYEEIGREAVDRLNAEGKPMVICLWHGETFALWRVAAKLKLTAVVSQSRDGEMLTRIITRTGFKVVRGSSSKGGASALRDIVRVMRRSAENPCVTMDGPRGPAKEVKDGVLFMAHLGKGLLVPTRIHVQRAIRLKSWDSQLIPLPFSRVRVIFAEPYSLNVEKLDAESVPRERERIKAKMDELDKYAY